MSLNIRPSTSAERKLLALETIINTTSEATKVSDESILSGIAGGIAKIAGKAEKDILLGISQLFPDTAFGSQLDQVAENFGIASRFGATGSSTYVRIYATPGTVYLAGTVTFTSTAGIRFQLAQDFTTPSFGFGYALVQSIEIGLKTNVDPLTINQVAPAPTGHINVINEYKADGGRDIESDELLRVRIKDGANILARGTLSMLEQLFISLNNKVLKISYQGHDLLGKNVISIQTVNGSTLSDTELNNLLVSSAEYLNLNDYRPFGTSFYGVKLINTTYGFVDISFRVQINSAYDPDEIRKAIQVNISKYIDPRFFDPTKQKVEWDNLLEICKNIPGVDYIPDQYFYPRQDIFFYNIVPRLRGFLMCDLNGAVIANYQGTISPQYYPAVIDASYFKTILNNN